MDDCYGYGDYGMFINMPLVCLRLKNILNSKLIEFFSWLYVFISRYNAFLCLFFQHFLLVYIVYFYYLCKLCLYDLCSSVFLGVNELAFMLYLLFLFLCYVAYSKL